MSEARTTHWASPPGTAASRPEGDVVELSLLVPAWQMEALETAARWRGLTPAQMARRVLAQFLHEQED